MKRIALLLSALALCAGCATTSLKPNRLSSEEKKVGWLLLFDGKSLTGWTPRDSARWAVVDGAIAYQPDTGPGFLCTTTSYADGSVG